MDKIIGTLIIKVIILEDIYLNRCHYLSLNEETQWFEEIFEIVTLMLIFVSYIMINCNVMK